MNRHRIALAALWIASLALTAGGWIGLVRSDRLLQIPGGQIVFVTFIALGAPLLASAMHRRHPHEATGVLVGITVLLAAVGGCRAASIGDFADVAGPTAVISALLPAVVIARYPGLQAPSDRTRLIGLLTAVAAILGAGAVAAVMARGAPPSPWWVTSHPAAAGIVANSLFAAYAVVVLAGIALTAGLVVGRYRANSRNSRSTLRPLVLPALGWLISATASVVWTFVAGIGVPHLRVTDGNMGTTFVLLPAVFVGAVAIGIAWLDLAVRRPNRPVGGRGLAGIPVEVYLSRALADPSVRVAYPVSIDETRAELIESWVDRGGRPVALRPDDPARAVTLIERDGAVIGLFEQDAAAASRPDAVELVATGAGLMMETERLTADANLDLETSRSLAARLLSATDEPREVLRTQLVDGPLAELTSVATALNAGSPLADAVPTLTAIAAQVRTISHGVFPAALATDGLPGALGITAPARRYPSVVELTAYLVAHEDSDPIIDEQVDGLRVTVRVEPPATVRDRVTVLGGRVRSLDDTWIVDIPISPADR